MKADTVLKPFSFERTLLLLRNRVLDDLPALAVAAGALVAINLLALVTGNEPILNTGGRSTAWPVIVAIGGVLLAGRAFERMQDGRSGPDWLLLPATSGEKYLSAMAMYLAVYPIVATLAAWGLSAILAFLGNLVGTGGGRVWNPPADLSLDAVSGYLSFAVIAIAGSARFRKFAIGKTAATGMAWIVVLTLVFGLVLTWLSPELRPFLKVGGNSAVRVVDGPLGGTVVYVNDIPLPEAKANAFRLLMDLFHWVTVAFAAAYGFALVREKEARDEVQ